MVINQGDVYWVDLGESTELNPDYNHPHVVIQNNMFNHSRLRTVLGLRTYLESQAGRGARQRPAGGRRGKPAEAECGHRSAGLHSR